MIKKSLVSLSILLLSACNYSLPKCDSSEVKSTLRKIVSKRLPNATDFHFSVDNAREVMINQKEQIRVCRADFDFLGEYIEGGLYRIYWGNKKEGKFIVELLN